MYSINVAYYKDVGIYSVSIRVYGIHESVRGVRACLTRVEALNTFIGRVRTLCQSNKDEETD